MQSWVNFGHKLYSSQHAVLANHLCRHSKRSNATQSVKDKNGLLLSNEEHTLGRWREYFKDLLNLGSHFHTIEHTGSTFSGEENTITANKVFPAVKTLKDAGCDEIRPEMVESLVHTIKSSRFSAGIRGISWMGSAFIFLRWFKLACTSCNWFPHRWRVWINQQIFNKKSISCNTTHHQSYNLIQIEFIGKLTSQQSLQLWNL